MPKEITKHKEKATRGYMVVKKDFYFSIKVKKKRLLSKLGPEIGVINAIVWLLPQNTSPTKKIWDYLKHPVTLTKFRFS